ncbi:MAG: DEAD/DEAH box helicase [Actinomycetes bacterium]
MELSPAEKYAASRARNAYAKTSSFQSQYSFPFDDFQIAGCQALEDGQGVLVAAPTGAGKTIVGEFAAYLAITSGNKCFYTTPIKALSNQKYQDLCAMFGDSKVGLLTGDTSFNSEAPIVVMTTEVLRNMLYAGSSTLQNLKFVVMDEVHYLADKFRGAVWEEILIHLPESVQVASLSATVSNAEEFGDWLQTVRGGTSVIVTEIRPVPLYQHVLFGNRLLDLFVEGGKVSPEILRLERETSRRVKTNVNKSRHSRGNWNERSDTAINIAYLSRAEVIEKLDREGLLPAITFIFSRKACDAAVHQCLSAGLKLTTADERSEIRAVIAKNSQSIPEDDLFVLGFHEWADGLERGVAAHHAGLLPKFKETVEELFQRGLIKAVFATETLALGINMPARTVVLEKLMKWNGETHVPVTPGEYTQLTGRAGRRGIDIEGNAVIIWNREVDSSSVAGLASTRTYPLKSSFKPTYNMAINLISQFGAQRARTSLESSFAQFQADKAVVGLARQIARNETAVVKLQTEVLCHLGDFMEYSHIRAEISDLEKFLSKRSRAKRQEIEEEISDLRKVLRSHPCHGCAEREVHARLAERIERLLRENRGLTERVNNRTNVIARRFDLVRVMLEKLGYIEGDLITHSGRLLSKIYGETDLLIAEMIRLGSFDELNGSELVSVLSSFLFEARRESSPKIPHGAVQEVLQEVVHQWHRIHEMELEIGLEPLREPDLGFCWASYRWANGHSLTAILKGTELTVGDFVRSMKQIIDLLRQLAIASPHMSGMVSDALKRIDRGIVSYAGAVI